MNNRKSHPSKDVHSTIDLIVSVIVVSSRNVCGNSSGFKMWTTTTAMKKSVASSFWHKTGLPIRPGQQRGRGSHYRRDLTAFPRPRTRKPEKIVGFISRRETKSKKMRDAGVEIDPRTRSREKTREDGQRRRN